MRRSDSILCCCWVPLTFFTSTTHAFSAQLRRPWERAHDRRPEEVGRPSEWDVLVLLGHHRGSSILEPSSSSHRRTSSSLLLLSLDSRHDGSQHPGDDEHEEATKEAYNKSNNTATAAESSSGSWSTMPSRVPPIKPFDSSHASHHHRFDSVSLSSLRRVNGAAYVPAPTVRNRLGVLFRMTRPENFPGVVLFHAVGVRLALQATPFADQYWRVVLKEPALWITLAVLLLTSSTSMVVNDYYDAKLGRDDTKHKPLVDGDVPMPVARRFVSYLYGAALLGLAFVPGVPTRLSVVVGLMLTYFYTQYLKPVTWWKNVVCASLIALSPLTSGSAALHLATRQNFYPQALVVASLWRLVSTLFFGVLGREITMDCNDCDADANSHIRTVPVVRGRPFASAAALISACLMAASAVSGPLWEVLTAYRGGGPAALAITGGALRRLVLASLASTAAIRRASQVFRRRGADKVTNDRAVQEGLLTVLVLLASFV